MSFVGTQELKKKPPPDSWSLCVLFSILMKLLNHMFNCAEIVLQRAIPHGAIQLD